MTDAGEIVLVRQYRHAIGRWAWELPAGSLKPGEDPEAAAVRECHEEIGLVPGAVERLGAFFPTPGYCDEEMNFYRATGCASPAPATPRRSRTRTRTSRPGRSRWTRSAAMIAAGEIIDLKTVAGLALMSRSP